MIIKKRASLAPVSRAAPVLPCVGGQPLRACRSSCRRRRRLEL